MRIIAKKSLGQNFLSSKTALEKIAQALEIGAGETVIEVGPGTGALTDEILKLKPELIVIEKDNRLIPPLASKYGKQAKIIEGDILEKLPKIAKELAKKGKNYKIIGNIPYYLTGQLLRIVPDLEKLPEICVFTIQKEVAERICVGSDQLNLLAAAIQGWGEPEKLFNLKRELFKPRPKVDSATIKIKTKKNLADQNYYRLLHHLFKQPRKNLNNNLKTLWREADIGKEKATAILESLNLSENLRPHNLSPEKIKKLADLVYT